MFKPMLHNSEEIVDFVFEFATSPLDEELVFEYFQGCSGILKYIPIENLEEGNENQNIRSRKKENLYFSLPSSTMPPLIVEDNKVIDGNHRLRVARQKGISIVAIYDIVPIKL